MSGSTLQTPLCGEVFVSPKLRVAEKRDRLQMKTSEPVEAGELLFVEHGLAVPRTGEWDRLLRRAVRHDEALFNSLYPRRPSSEQPRHAQLTLADLAPYCESSGELKWAPEVTKGDLSTAAARSQYYAVDRFLTQKLERCMLGGDATSRGFMVLGERVAGFLPGDVVARPNVSGNALLHYALLTPDEAQTNCGPGGARNTTGSALLFPHPQRVAEEKGEHGNAYVVPVSTVVVSVYAFEDIPAGKEVVVLNPGGAREELKQMRLHVEQDAAARNGEARTTQVFESFLGREKCRRY